MLKEYLSEREKSVISIMLSVFDEETVCKLYEAAYTKKAWKKAEMIYLKHLGSWARMQLC